MVRDALNCIPPTLDRDTWVRLAMAVKAELGADGFDLWDNWSRQAEGYSALDARDTWRSIKAGGGVTVATLFGMAKDHGWRRPADAPATPTAIELQRQAERKRQQREAEEAAYRARADRAAKEAARLWADASTTGQSDYLARKGVQAHGVRYLADGTLLVPLRDALGELQNLQRIAGQEPGEGQSGKRFLPGGRKTGLWHWVGQPEGAPVLLLAEGYATAASLHEATGRPVAVGFDAGNLVHVAKALRGLYPAAPLLVCGDDDADTEARTGTNPGRKKGTAAARAAHTEAAPAAAVFPAGLPDGGSDFNDLATHAGAAAVRALVDAAAAALKVGPRLVAAGEPSADVCTDAGPAVGEGLHLVAGAATVPQARQRGKAGPGAPQSPGDGAEPRSGADSPASGQGRRGRRGGNGGGGGGGGSGGNGEGPGDGAGGGGEADPPEWDAFTVDEAGVWHTARDAEGNRKRPQWLCTRMDVTARTRADDANGWGYLLEFTDPDGNPKTWAMPSAMLSGDGSEWAGRLRDMGLRMAPGTAARNLVARYIDTRNPPERVTCTDRVGWHGPVYVLPSGSIASDQVAAEGRRYVFQSDSGMEDTFRRHGTLAQWQAEVSALCVGNSRLAFAVCCAFAGPMLRLAEVESGGVHFRGDSSQGKTTALRVATSVWGRPSYMQRWRTTDNALEATAVQHCDALLVLDEFGQLDPRVAGDVAYMLANDAEKSRGTRSGLLRKRRTWRLLFLSSGEVSLAQHMDAAGKTARAGQEVRMLDIPLDAGAGMGGLEQLHGHERPAVMADAIVSAAGRFYGTPGRAWLEWACDHFAELPARLVALMTQYRDDMVPEAAAEQVRRAGTRFALIAAAGELATEAGITGWPVGEAARAGRQCFNAWLGARGHLNNGEEAAMLRRVRGFLESHGEGRFTWFHRAMDDRVPKTLNRAGFRRLLGEDGKPVKSDSDHQREYGERISAQDGARSQVEYMVLREVFMREVCQGFDSKAVAELLQARGHLEHEAGRLTIRHRLPGMGKAPVYHLKASIFDDEL